MIPKAKLKWIKSLQVKKYRQAEQCFLVQGSKGVMELLQSSYEVVLLAATAETISSFPKHLLKKPTECFVVSNAELESMSSFQSNDSAIAVAKMKVNSKPKFAPDEFILVLDDLRDPGNLGTIIRTADWFGIKNIVASPHTAEFYNPKTISATMGSFCRVQLFYTELSTLLTGYSGSIYGTFLSGRNIHEENFGNGGVIIIGNESNGISPAVELLVTNRISIPGAGKTESLNAAIALGIVLDNVFRG